MTEQEVEARVMHPTLPGEDLGCEWLDGGARVCLYDPANPEAYIVGAGVEVGVFRRS